MAETPLAFIDEPQTLGDVRYAEMAPPSPPKGRIATLVWYIRAWVRMRWLMLQIRLQVRVRMWLGIERDFELVTQHIRQHERGFDILRQDYDLAAETEKQFRKRYQALTYQRMDNLHAMQTSRHRMLEQEVRQLQQGGKRK
jgi:hypothetical protein